VDLDIGAGSPTLTGGELVNLAHGGAFYSPRIGRTVTVPRRGRLTLRSWSDIAAALATNESPPIWTDYFMSAQQRVEIADLKAGIIDLQYRPSLRSGNFQVLRAKTERSVSPKSLGSGISLDFLM
jgi:hypothetical protein